jgi:hypothetical protein
MTPTAGVPSGIDIRPAYAVNSSGGNGMKSR